MNLQRLKRKSLTRFLKYDVRLTKIPGSLQGSIDLNESETSWVNFSKEMTSFSIPLRFPSSSEELTIQKWNGKPGKDKHTTKSLFTPVKSKLKFNEAVAWLLGLREDEKVPGRLRGKKRVND